MNHKGSRLEATLTSILVICAVVVTALVVKRELATGRPESQGAPGLSFRQGWEEYFATDKTFGDPSGRIRVVEFVDFQCPFCTLFAHSLDTLRAMYPGEVYVAIRHFPLSMRRNAARAARAAECALRQGTFERFYQQAFSVPDSMWSERLSAVAEEMGIPEPDQLASCVETEWARERVARDSVDGVQAGVTGTPMVMMNGWVFPGTPSVRDMVAVIEREKLLR